MKKNTKLSSSEYKFINEFYENNKKLIYYLVVQCGVEGAEVEDVVQDIVLRLMNYIPSLVKIRSNKNQMAKYIAQTVKSVCIDRNRAQKSRQLAVIPVEMIEAIYKDLPDRTEIPEHITAQWDVDYLRKKLPRRDWDLLSGKYIIGYSDHELASRLGCTQESVRMALTRARRNARKILEAEKDE